MKASLFRCGLSYREMLGMSWQLAWPSFLLYLAWTLVAQGVLDIGSGASEISFGIPYLLIIAPWLVRRMFRRSYVGFRLLAMREHEIEMGHAESFKVMWLLNWRMLVPLMLLLLLLSSLLQFVKVDLASMVPKSSEAPILNSLGASFLETLAGLFLTPFVIPGMFAKRYDGFRIGIERLNRPNAASRR